MLAVVRSVRGVEERVNARRNAIVAGDLPLRIDVDLAEDYFARLALCGRQLFEDWRDDLARSAPVGVEVDDCVGGRGGDCTEVGRGGD